MTLPNIGSPDWGWSNVNGWYAVGVEPKWEISIRCGWIEIAFYPTEKATVMASLDLPAPDNDEDAKKTAEQCAIYLQDKLYALAYKDPSIAKQIPRSATDGHA